MTLRQITNLRNVSVIVLLNGLVPKSKLKDLPAVVTNRLNKKGVLSKHNKPYFSSNVQNQLYNQKVLQDSVADEVYLMLKEWGISDEQISNFR
jgi:hypothetical protein